MTCEETLNVLSMIADFYPDFSKRNFKAMATAWHRLLGDLSYELVTDALRSYIMTDLKGFAPTPGMLVAQIEQKAADEYMSEAEAWDRIIRAISRSGYYALEEFEKLPRILQEVVGSPFELHEWSNMLSSEVNTVIAGQLRRAYRDAVQRDIRTRFRPPFRAALPDARRPLLPEGGKSGEKSSEGGAGR